MAGSARVYELERDAPAGRAAWLWQHLGGVRGVALRLGFVVLAVVAARAHVMRGDSLLVLLAIAVPGALLARRSAAPLALYAAAWLAFSLLRAGANDLALPDQGATAAALDRLLGNGLTPTEHLQRAFYRPGHFGLLDAVAIWVHTSYYVTPHLVAVLLWWRGRGSGLGAGARSIRSRIPNPQSPIPTPFTLYVRASLVLMAVGLLLYALVPTAPPWLHGTSEDDMTVHRITRASNAGATRDPDQVYTFFTDPNPVAAMPSLHQAFTILMALALYRERRRLGIFAACYAAAMGFALVYLGEHYVVDVLAGALLAVVAVVVVGRWRVWGWGSGFGIGDSVLEGVSIALNPQSRIPYPDAYGCRGTTVTGPASASRATVPSGRRSGTRG
jgi:membrane-associated phospholipid phosphatase